MHIPRLSTTAAALPVAALLLMGSAVPAQALECAPGLVPAVVDGVEICAVNSYSPSGPEAPAPPYNPGESHYDPATGNHSEAVPAVPVPAAPSSPAPAEPEPTPSTTETGGTGTTGPGTGGTAVLTDQTGTPSPGPSRTASPSPSQAVDEERAGSDMVLPAIAAVVILGLLAGGLLLRHRNRSARR